MMDYRNSILTGYKCERERGTDEYWKSLSKLRMIERRVCGYTCIYTFAITGRRFAVCGYARSWWVRRKARIDLYLFMRARENVLMRRGRRREDGFCNAFILCRSFIIICINVLCNIDAKRSSVAMEYCLLGNSLSLHHLFVNENIKAYGDL